jgi:hypothetical protein
MSTNVVLFLLIVLFIIGFYHFKRNNDEIPLVLVVFNLLVITRLYALESGEAEWVNFNYGISFNFDLEQAHIVNDLIFLGTCIIVISYLLFYKKNESESNDSESYFDEFINEKKGTIIIGFALFYLFKMVAGNSLGVGYSFLLTLANCSFIILTFLVFYKLKAELGKKIIYGIIFGLLAFSTYNPYLRYQFLGWAIPIIVYTFRKSAPLKKAYIYGIGIVVASIFFSIAGTLRSEGSSSMTTEGLFDEGVARLTVGEDVNFIDGFIMLYQVYPQYLDFHYGMDHIGILLRPIPRALWPGKPEGGWHQKYAEKYNNDENFVTGISPTLYGVFYGEGGLTGIIIFSIIWGFFFTRLMIAIQAYELNLQYILKGMLFASLLPVLRSGDLAGDISIIGMSYWPIFIFIYQYNKFIKQKKEEIYEY